MIFLKLSKALGDDMINVTSNTTASSYIKGFSKFSDKNSTLQADFE
jgi:hypothetical protein